jgi:hypothetical protein
MIPLFNPLRFLFACLSDIMAHLLDRYVCWLAGHDDHWVKRSTGPRCECGRCGRPVAR